DTRGFSAERNATFVLVQDTTAPVLQTIRTSLEYNDAYYVSDALPIIAEFAEQGSGFYDKKVYLDGFGQATRCEAGWRCYFDNLSFSNSGPIMVQLSSASDDAGNSVNGSQAYPLIVDNDAPQIQTVYAYSLTENGV